MIKIVSLSLTQKTMRNWGASEELAGRISQRQGSRSSETVQNPARVTLSAEAVTDPNSKTVTSARRRGTATAPFIPGTSAGLWVVVGCFGLDSDSDTGLGCCGCGLPLNQDSKPMSGWIENWNCSVYMSVTEWATTFLIGFLGWENYDRVGFLSNDGYVLYFWRVVLDFSFF